MLRRTACRPFSKWIPRTGRTGAQERLAEIRNSFRLLTSGLEPRLLPLTNRLSDLASSLTDLAGQTDSHLRRLRESLRTGTLGTLEETTRGAIDRSTREVELNSQWFCEAATVLSELRQIARCGRQTAQIAVSLQVAGCNFKVESARIALAPECLGFVDELRGFTDQIRDLGARLESGANSSGNSMEATRLMLQQSSRRIKALNRQIQSSFAATTAEARDLIDITNTAVENASQNRQAIADLASALVYHLQFGDMIRQKCEHIAAALDDILPQAPNRHRPIQIHSTQVQLILRTQLAQLDVVLREIDQAQAHLSELYGDLELQITRLVESSGNLEADGRRFSLGTSSPFRKLQDRIDEFEQLTGEEDRMRTSAQNASTLASNAAAQLENDLVFVRPVSARFHLLAVNAEVQTSHLLERGSALQVIVHQITRLHVEFDSAIRDLKELSCDVKQRLGQSKAGQDLPPPQRIDLQKQLHQIQEEFAEFRAQISHDTSAAFEQLRDAAAPLDQLAAIRTELEQHRADLERFIDTATPAPRSGTDLLAVNQLLTRYTMASERETHHWAASAPPIDTSPAPQPDQRELCPANDANNGFGDNVDLF